MKALKPLPFAAALLAMLAVSQPSSARGPDMLQRQGPWRLASSGEFCQLEGTFGTGKGAVTVSLIWFDQSDRFDLRFTGQAVKSSRGYGPMKIGFAPANRLRSVTMLGQNVDGQPVAFVGAHQFDNADPVFDGEGPPARATNEQLAATTALAARTVQGRAVVLDLGPMVQPVAAVRACMDANMRDWGLDPQQQHTLTRMARPQIRRDSLLGGAEFPPGEPWVTSFVHVRVMVDAAGKGQSCHVQQRIGSRAIAETTCNRVLNATRYQPAIDAEGRPVPSFVSYRTVWVGVL